MYERCCCSQFDIYETRHGSDRFRVSNRKPLINRHRNFGFETILSCNRQTDKKAVILKTLRLSRCFSFCGKQPTETQMSFQMKILDLKFWLMKEIQIRNPLSCLQFMHNDTPVRADSQTAVCCRKQTKLLIICFYFWNYKKYRSSHRSDFSEWQSGGWSDEPE